MRLCTRVSCSVIVDSPSCPARMAGLAVANIERTHMRPSARNPFPAPPYDVRVWTSLYRTCAVLSGRFRRRGMIVDVCLLVMLALLVLLAVVVAVGQLGVVMGVG